MLVMLVEVSGANPGHGFTAGIALRKANPEGGCTAGESSGVETPVIGRNVCAVSGCQSVGVGCIASVASG